MRRTAWLFLVALVMPFFTPSPVRAQPLLDELHSLLATHPAIKASLSEDDARREEITVARSGQLPFLQTTSESGFERTDQPQNDQIRKQAGLSITQNLFDGYATRNQVRASELNERVGYSDFQSTQSALLLDGIQSYLDVVLQNKLVEVSSRHVDIVQEISDFIARERDGGRMTLADSLQSRARLQQARETLISLEGERRNSIARYQTLFGQPPDIRSMDDPLAPTTILPASPENALDFAHDHNPVLEAARLNIDMANAQRMASGASDMPRLDLQGAVDFKNDYDGVSGNEKEGSLLLKLTWDLYDGSRTSATEMAAAHRESAALAALQQRELEVAEQVRMAWGDMMTDHERTKTLGEAQSIALEAYNARHSLMETGKETIINVLDTALEVLSVRLSLITSEYRYRLSVYRLLYAMGRLTPDSINSVISVGPLDMTAIGNIVQNTLAPADLIQTPVVTSGSSMAEQTVSSAPLSEPIFPTQTASSAQPAAVNAAATIEQQSGFLVVLSSNRDQQNAQQALQKLNLQGVEIEVVDVNGKPMYMVIIGPLPEPEARVVQGEAIDAGVLDAWLKKL